MSEAQSDGGRALVRHMLATIAYRGAKAIRNAPAGFSGFRADGAMNTPLMLLAHIGDLMEWGLGWSRDGARFRTSAPVSWEAEVARFHELLERFDQFLESGAPMQATAEKLMQAPIADALTHIGQLALLRRMAGDPVLGEAYRLAEIVAGRVGPEQAKPGFEFELDKGAIWRGPEGRG